MVNNFIVFVKIYDWENKYQNSSNFSPIYYLYAYGFTK